MAKEPEHFRGMPRPVSVAAIQMACDWDAAGNIARAERLVREAARQGAQIILLPELFETPYFCIEQDARHLALARPVAENPAVRHFAAVARELGVVLPISFFERAGHAYFNSIAILDADGTQPRRLPQVAHPQRPRLPGEELLRARRHRLPRLGRRVSRASASASAGTSGFPRPRASWRSWGRSCSCFRRPSAASRRRRCRSTHASTGSARSRAMPPPT